MRGYKYMYAFDLDEERFLRKVQAGHMYMQLMSQLISISFIQVVTKATFTKALNVKF